MWCGLFRVAHGLTRSSRHSTSVRKSLGKLPVLQLRGGVQQLSWELPGQNFHNKTKALKLQRLAAAFVNLDDEMNAIGRNEKDGRVRESDKATLTGGASLVVLYTSLAA